MKKNQELIISRRSVVLFAGAAAGLGLLGTRMIQLQVHQHKSMLALAERNRTNWKILLPKRGAIIDRTGVVLADSAIEYDLYLEETWNDIKVEQMQQLLRLISRSPDEYAQMQDSVLGNARRPLLLMRDIPRAQLVLLEYYRHLMPRFSIKPLIRRRYVQGTDTAPIIGYVGRPSPNERHGKNFELIDEFRIGKTGIERQYEEVMRGYLGQSAVKVDVLGQTLGEVVRNESTVGANVRLHIHAKIQSKTMDLLRQHPSASAVILDAQTGGVIALASHPFYNANELKEAITPDRWQALISDPLKPMVNKSISGLYAPGSTLKPIIALAALQSGIPTHQSHFCSGALTLGNNRFHCWKKEGHGNVDMHAAIQKSCDVWFYHVARQLGIDSIADTARQFGFGQVTGIDIQNEKAGLVPDNEWKRRVLNQPFYPGEVMIHGIGQGYFQVNPLQIARSYAAIINGGKLLSPRLFDRTDGDAQLFSVPTRTDDLHISDQHLAFIQRALISAVNEPHGTAWRSRLDLQSDGFLMAGKTGTTQVRRITPDERAQGIDKEDIDWHLRDHALFAGFAPLDQPRYVAVALVEHGVSGARTAAPIVRDMFRIMAAERLIKGRK